MPAPGGGHRADVPTAGPVASGVDETRLTNLRRWNVALTVLHAAQALVVLLLATDFAITVTSTFPQGPPGTAPPAPEALFDVRIGWAIAAFLLLAALDHGLTGTVMRARYEDDLRRGINRFRWAEYSVSATIMIVRRLRPPTRPALPRKICSAETTVGHAIPCAHRDPGPTAVSAVGGRPALPRRWASIRAPGRPTRPPDHRARYSTTEPSLVE